MAYYSLVSLSEAGCFWGGTLVSSLKCCRLWLLKRRGWKMKLLLFGPFRFPECFLGSVNCYILRPFPRVLLCPRNIPKLRSCMGLVAVWIWASLIVVLLFFGSICVACWVWASNPSANFATCQATRCYKKPKLLGWDPPPPPRISITDIRCHLTLRVVWLIRGGGGSEAKSPAFCNGSNCEQGLYACLWSGHLFLFHTSQYRFIWWTWHRILICTLGP